MRKVYLLLLVLTVMTISCSENLPDVKYMGLNGEIELFREKKFDIIERFEEIIEKELTEDCSYNFNDDGELIKQIWYDRNGDVNSFFEKSFEGNQCVLMQEIQKYDDESITHTLKEGTSDYELWEVRYSDRESLETSEVVIKNLTRIATQRSEKGDVISKTEEIYNKKGNLMKLKVLHDGELFYQIKFEYETFSQLLKKSVTGVLEENFFTYKYTEFDEKGNWIKCIEYDKSIPVAIIKREIIYK